MKNIYTFSYIKEGQKENGSGSLVKEIMAENFPSLRKETDIRIKET